jgi:hypothetical protein
MDKKRWRPRQMRGSGGGEAEVAMQQPVGAETERRLKDNRQRSWQTGGGGVTRCNATTSQDE